MKIPKTIVAGDSIIWIDQPTKDSQGRMIAPPDWTLSYALRGSGGINLTATVENGQWKTEMTAAQSASLTPGVLYWSAFAARGSERITLGSGDLTLKPNLATVDAPFDGRSQAEIDLAQVQSAIRNMVAGGAVAEYTIGNRSLRKLELSDLRALESKLKVEVMREKKLQQIANGLGNPETLRVRFT